MRVMENDLKISETATSEEEILRFWKVENIFEKSLEKQSPKGEFVFYDGPPFATGLPHIGHILSSSIKDTISRYKTMRGYHVRRSWGWDCHGLPIESLVEKKLGLSSKKDIDAIGIKNFNSEARSIVLEFVQEWERYIERIGRWVDFKGAYKTMDTDYIESVWWAIKDLYSKGFIYEGKRVLMYCPHCETPLAKAEISMDNTYKDITEESVIIKFKLIDGQSGDFPKNTYILAWTTTPWTLPGNVALAVDKKTSYLLSEFEGNFYVYAKDRAEDLDMPITGKEFLGKELLGLEYEPLYKLSKVTSHLGKKWIVVPADFVTVNEGTGIVHIAVMYGEDDFNLGKVENLPMVQILNANATYNADAPSFLFGKHIRKGVVEIKNDLENRGFLFKREPYTHSYPHCYRCGTALIYNAVNSWFIKVQENRNKLLDLNKKITWIPSHLKEGRFNNILETAPDWTISRNRYWASPLPIWKCESCHGIDVIGSVDELRSKAQQEVPDGIDLHRPYIDVFTMKCACGGSMRRTPEVLDCWFESGSMPFAELHYPFEQKSLFQQRFPAHFITEYIAQTRTWFYYLHVLGALLFNRQSFLNVVTTGTVLASDGAKMSKSKGNFTDPLINIDAYGADAVRFYLLNSILMQAEDLSFKDEELRDTHNKIIGMLGNSLKFYNLYSNNSPVKNKEGFVVNDSSHVLDRWMEARLALSTSDVTEAMESYDLVSATRELRVIIEDMSLWYVRRSRDRVRSNKEQSHEALGSFLSRISILSAPITPFISERIYRSTDVKLESVHLAQWPDVNKSKIDKELLKDMERVRSIASKILMLRQQAGIRVRQPLAKAFIPASLSTDLVSLLKEEVNVKEIILNSDKVGLDTVLTAELIREGNWREFIRAVADARKDLNLLPSKKVRIGISKEFERVLDGITIPGVSEIIFAEVEMETIHKASLSVGEVPFTIK